MIEQSYPRKFVDRNETLDALHRIQPYFRILRERCLDSVQELEQWLLDCSELAAVIGEVRTDRYVQMTCHTDDENLRLKYLDFVENIDPECRRQWHELDIRFVDSPVRNELSPQRYFVLDRNTRAAVELFREENLPLIVEETKLAQEYQSVCGAMTVEFDGKEQTLPQMAVYGEDTDRRVREEAWCLAARRRLQDREKLDDLFDAMVSLRRSIAENSGLPDYRAYAFCNYNRFDYTPQDCVAFHDAIERAVVPAVKSINDRRRAKLNLPTLRPWDLGVDEEGRERLHPFETVDELCEKCGKVLLRVDAEFAEQFNDMRQNGFLDLESRKGKAPGGYQSTFDEKRHPFIFMNAVGLHRDVITLLHECGHSFHTYACRDDDLLAYRSAPIEFAEVASMTMELLGMDHGDLVYDEEELVRARRKHLEGILRIFPWVAVIDEFQHWIYTNPGHNSEQRRKAWCDIHHRFDAGVDYSGLEDVEASLWQRQLHLFEVPFYYVEYAIAQLGALQIWMNWRAEPTGAVTKYRTALALGGSRPLGELFETAGAGFDFSYDTLAPLIEAVCRELDSLDG